MWLLLKILRRNILVKLLFVKLDLFRYICSNKESNIDFYKRRTIFFDTLSTKIVVVKFWFGLMVTVRWKQTVLPKKLLCYNMNVSWLVAHFSIQCNIILRKKYFMKELHESEYLSKHFQVQLFGPPFHPHLFLYRNQYIWKMINTLTLFT